MIDRVEFVAPLGPIGRVVERAVLDRYLRHLIGVRNTFLIDAATQGGRRSDSSPPTMNDSRNVEAFSFAFEPPLDTWARWFAIVPTRSFVRIDDHGLEAVYGSWRVATTWSNVRSVERTGPYRPWKVAGPVRMSMADRGITMAATTAGACLRLHEPVPGLDPFGLFRHPSITLGVEDARPLHPRRRSTPGDRTTQHGGGRPTQPRPRQRRWRVGRAARLAAKERRHGRSRCRPGELSESRSRQRHGRSAARDRRGGDLPSHLSLGHRCRRTLR